MSGFMGGQSGLEKQTTSNLGNVFNWSLPQAQAGQAAGKETLGQAKDYWTRLLQPGRAQATALAAPVTNTALDQADAARAQAGAMGTGRTGGTAALQREAGASTTKSIDDLITQSMTGGRAAGAAGLQSAAGMEMQNANQLAGLGLGAEQDVAQLAQAESARQAAVGRSIGGMLGNLAFGFLGGGMGLGGGGGGNSGPPYEPPSLIGSDYYGVPFNPNGPGIPGGPPILPPLPPISPGPPPFVPPYPGRG